MKLYPKGEQPCVQHHEYNQYKCYESYFSKQRGCQYPWNTYTDLDVPVCSNYGTIEKLLPRTDAGRWREKLGYNERAARTEGTCPNPCEGTKYDVTLEKWQDWRSGCSLQITLTDFTINNEEEYLACDMTCVIGELGGNLGFFLGGSIWFGFNIIVEYLSKILNRLHLTHNDVNV